MNLVAPLTVPRRFTPYADLKAHRRPLHLAPEGGEAAEVFCETPITDAYIPPPGNRSSWPKCRPCWNEAEGGHTPDAL